MCLSQFCTLKKNRNRLHEYSKIRQFDTYLPNSFPYKKPRTLDSNLLKEGVKSQPWTLSLYVESTQGRDLEPFLGENGVKVKKKFEIKIPSVFTSTTWMKFESWSLNKIRALALRQYGLWSFQTGGTKLERFLPKNQHHTQKKLLNFGNWISGDLRSFQKSEF